PLRVLRETGRSGLGFCDALNPRLGYDAPDTDDLVQFDQHYRRWAVTGSIASPPPTSPGPNHAEFHGDQNQRWRRLLLLQHRLDIRDAASLCTRREFSDEAGSQSGRHAGNGNYEREPANL